MAERKVHLVRSSQAHISKLMTWFTTPNEMYSWGAISRLMSIDEFTRHLRASHLTSYSLLDERHHLQAFGQHYLRINRHHLGRLAVNPEHRGRGFAKILITTLINKAFEQQSAEGVSLFVFRDNLAAYRCYQSMGFEERNYPGGIPGSMQNCAYMILPERESPKLPL